MGTVTPGKAAPQHLAASMAVVLGHDRWMALAKCKSMESALFFPHDEVGVRLAEQSSAIYPETYSCLEYA